MVVGSSAMPQDSHASKGSRVSVTRNVAPLRKHNLTVAAHSAKYAATSPGDASPVARPSTKCSTIPAQRRASLLLAHQPLAADRSEGFCCQKGFRCVRSFRCQKGLAIRRIFAADSAAALGVTAQLAGHTHGGQVWPVHWFAATKQPASCTRS